MLSLNKKFCAMTLGLVLMFAAALPVSAQSFGRGFGGSMSNKKKAVVIGGGAVAGAVLGGVLGGKKGAVLGGVLGAGAGTGYVYVKGKREQDRYGYYGDDYRYRDGYRYSRRNRRF